MRPSNGEIRNWLEQETTKWFIRLIADKQKQLNSSWPAIRTEELLHFHRGQHEAYEYLLSEVYNKHSVG